MNRVTHARLLPLATIATFVACSGGGTTAGLRTGGEFVVLKTEPSDNGTLFLNDAIRVDFSNRVNLDTVDLSTFAFVVKDQLGNVVAEPVAGNFSLGASPGDADVGRRLLFSPRLPVDDLFTTGGFRPGRTYEVQLVGGTRVNGTVITDQGGRPLAQLRSFRFSTADGTSPSQLFRNTAAGGPRRTALEITPTPETTGVVLNKLGAPALEIRLKFDQPLNPSSSNVPVTVDTNPLTRNPNNRGRVYLEYDDPEYGLNRWLPSDIELERNALDGATVVVRPLGVLPNNATIRVVVERTLEDISGESNFSNAAYDRVFGTFKTSRSYEQQFDGIVDSFTTTANLDLAAAFGEPLAEVGPGYVKAGFEFEGTSTGVEFEPTVPETILNTNFTQVTPKVGAAYNVSGGVFNFKNVKIPSGRTVIGQGTNPMVWLVSGTFEVAGLLSVRGGDGQRVNTSGNASVPKAGGVGVCGGGDGGNGSPSATGRDSIGGTGNGPMQVAGRGGVGGSLACLAGCNRGAGGGGGSFATQGDPNFKQKVAPPNPPQQPLQSFQQQLGVGGQGCVGVSGAITRQVPGAVPGPAVFVDARNDNNFWGVGVRFDGSRLRITGELAAPIGGGGGGGGGDLSYNTSCNPDPTFESDSSGGGGGGGGGVLVVKALGTITISEGGRITADGGHGGGGEPNATCTRGGGGGGGAGGMVVLMSATGIDINARGSGTHYRYATENDYEFSISADGGVCTTLAAAPVVGKKYMPTGAPASQTWGDITTTFATLYDSAPLGGFGGMGIVQLMAPPGTNGDGTNTVLDDNIRMIRGGQILAGNAKRDMLAWRGYPNQLGQGVDDSGTPTNIGDNEGDIRPAPTLLPAPFGTKTRLRSTWIDTGASKRRRLDADDNTARAIIDPSNTLPGPRYEFAGLNQATGYADFTAGSLAKLNFPIAVASVGILTTNANASYLGRPAYRVELVTSALGDVDRYVGYEAELLDSSDSQLPAPAVSSFRIVSHDDRALVLSPEAGALPSGAARLRVRAKFFNVITGEGANALEGLGNTYLGAAGGRVPIANVRIGFAFHTDPASATGIRFPAAADTYLYNLADPAVQQQVRTLGAAFVQWDILFDTAFKSAPTDSPPALSSDTPRPKLEFLRLPFRF